ncbi:Na(+)/H(+) antiporter subunit B [Paenibacillus fonticola]|uniref:Na(+)/H(+) antiporter subunit B n=1 Tax=Paenibacillus fonticola TaxID=379896 RepID=UPI0003725AFF|nr:Na(+)/H(+) antiporter subunit B [Paenibacillus fonticola]
MKINDVILQTVTKIVVFIILTMAVYLFVSGHNSPGGGFIGGLVLASALVLLFLAFDTETIMKRIPLDFKMVAAVGAFITVATGAASLFLDIPFLSHAYSYVNLPVFGKTGLATVTIFELGVALGVVGVVVTIILSISEDV